MSIPSIPSSKFYVDIDSSSDEVPNENPPTPLVLEPFMLPGEVEVTRAHKVLLFHSFTEKRKGISGTLFLTNFKLSFQTLTQGLPLPRDALEHNFLSRYDVCLSAIESIGSVSGGRVKKFVLGERINSRIKSLLVRCKDFRLFFFGFKFTPTENEVSMLVRTLLHYSFPDRVSLHFAFDYKTPAPVEYETHQSFSTANDWVSELERTGCPGWRPTYINEDFKYFHDLPVSFVVPLNCSDEMLLKSKRHAHPFQNSKIHSDSCRIPIWTWGRKSGAALVRMGKISDTENSDASISLLSTVQHAHPRQEKPVILDLEERIGVPSDAQTAFTKLRDLCTPISQKEFQDLDNRFYSDLHSTSWLQLVSRCLTVAYLAAWNIQNGKSTVILTEEKAVDFAPLVASLTQLLLDRSSRTIQGFQSLIQKEWVSLGHPFRDRYGRAGSGDEYRAPIFHLFLDSVWQIMQQFPAAFSFSETYLTALADSLHISLFDTFLFNCDEERARYRKDHQLRARSVWSWGQQYSKPQQSHFRNPLTEVESLLNNRGRIREEENYIEEASMPTLRRKMRSQATPSFRASRARSLPAAQIETLMNIFKPIPQDPGRKEEELVVSNYPLKDNGQTRHRLAGLSIEWHLHSVLPVRPEVDQLQIWEQAYFSFVMSLHDLPDGNDQYAISLVSYHSKGPAIISLQVAYSKWIPKSAIQGGGPPIHRLFHLRMLEDIRSLVDLLDDSKRSPDGSPPVGFTKVVSTNGIISTAPFYPDSLEKPHTYISSKSEHSIKGKVELDVPETVYSLSDTSSPHVGNSSERIPSDLLMTLPVQR